jgi:hypothetical protein
MLPINIKLIVTFCIAHGRMALSLQRHCTRFFAAIWLRHRSNSGFAGTEPAEVPYAKTGMKTHDKTGLIIPCNN